MNPTVGIPVFFIGVMATSLFIHYQLITKTNWFSGIGFPEGTAQIDQAPSDEAMARVGEYQ